MGIFKKDDESKKYSKILVILPIIIIVLLILIAIYYFIFNKLSIKLYGNMDMVIEQNSEFVDPGYEVINGFGKKTKKDIKIDGFVNTSVPGEYIISYSIGEDIKKRKVTVISSAPERITFLILKGNSIIKLKIGEEYIEPGYEVKDNYQSGLDKDVVVTSNLDVNKAGLYKITYSINVSGINLTKERTVVVEEIYVTSISMDKTDIKLTEGKSSQLKVTLLPDSATNKKVIWETSDSKIVSVNDGKITALKAGSAVITVKSSNGKTATCKVSVVEDNSPISSDGTINNKYFNIKTDANTLELANETSKQITKAINYASENGIRNIKLKKGRYVVGTILHEGAKRGTIQNINTGIYIVKSNINLDLNGSTIELFPNGQTRNRIIYIGHANNVSIFNGTILGDKGKHKCKDGTLYDNTTKCVNDTPKDHSYDHGILIQSSKNIRIENLTIKNTMGDGIYMNNSLGSNLPSNNNKNILVLNNKIEYTGRNGITLIHAEDVTIKGNIIHDNDYGVKLEPNDANYKTDNYPVRNLTIEGNTIYNVSSHSSMTIFRSANVVIKNNYLSDEIHTCGKYYWKSGKVREDRCFETLEDDYANVKIEGNKVYKDAPLKYTAPELININCYSSKYGDEINSIEKLPWIMIDKTWYYIDTSKGELIKNQTKKIDGTNYTFNEKGICTNCQNLK